MMLSSLCCWCFAADVGVAGHGKGGGEQGEVTCLYSQLVDMKNEICLGTQIYSVVAITSILTSIPNVFNNELSSLAEKRKNEIIR